MGKVNGLGRGKGIVYSSYLYTEDGEQHGFDWAYRSDDPVAVKFVVYQPGYGEIEWNFARELLRVGINESSGEGDVNIEPCVADPAMLVLTLSPPEGTAMLFVPRHDAASFLRETYRMVPQDQEERYLGLDELTSFPAEWAELS